MSGFPRSRHQRPNQSGGSGADGPIATARKGAAVPSSPPSAWGTFFETEGQSLDACSETINERIFFLTDAIQTRLSVSRFYVSGSYGRRVATCSDCDVDLIVFLKHNIHGLPPYNDEKKNLFLILIEALQQEAAAAAAAPTDSNSNDNGSKSTSEIKVTSRVPESIYYYHGRESICPSECPFWGSWCKNEKSDVRGRLIPDHVKVTAENAKFRVFLAPALGKTSEEQRQVTYRKMQGVLMDEGFKRGLPKLDGWHCALLERPSEAIAHESDRVHMFIRCCRHWAFSHGIKSLDPYAVEMIGFTASQWAVHQQYLQLLGVDNRSGFGSGPSHGYWESGHRNDLSVDTADAGPGILSFRKFMMEKLRFTTASSSPSLYAYLTTAGAAAGGSENHGGGPAAAATAALLKQAEMFDLGLAFKYFLETCRDLRTVSPFWDIAIPASFMSPWDWYAEGSDYEADGGGRANGASTSSNFSVVTDFFNPYRNLLRTVTKSDLIRLASCATDSLNTLRRPEPSKAIFEPTSSTGAGRPGRKKREVGSRRGPWRWMLSLLFVLGALYASVYWLERSNSAQDWRGVPEIVRSKIWVDQSVETFFAGVVERTNGADWSKVAKAARSLVEKAGLESKFQKIHEYIISYDIQTKPKHLYGRAREYLERKWASNFSIAETSAPVPRIHNPVEVDRQEML